MSSTIKHFQSWHLSDFISLYYVQDVNNFVLQGRGWLVGFLVGSAGKKSACNAGDVGSVPALGRSPGEGNSYPLQYSDLENSRDCIVHGVTKNEQFVDRCS